MTSAPRMLDLFCGAGGAGEGYRRAGFDVRGVDLALQPRCPYPAYRDDALRFLEAHWREYDAFHASPPCQRWTRIRHTAPGPAREHPDLIGPVRELLIATGRPYVIENVPGAPLLLPIMLCGTMFPGLRVYRHRHFESTIPLYAPPHGRHEQRLNRAGRKANAGGWLSVAGHFPDTDKARVAMGIDWMSRNELSQAIPPAYTAWVGAQLMGALR